MKQFLGKGGLLEELTTYIDKVIDVYVEVFDQKGTVDYDLDENTDGTLSVTFTWRSCGCCPGDEIGRFYISQAMLENPKKELEKLKKERDDKQAEKDKVKKHKEALAKRREKRSRKKLYSTLKKEFE